MPIINYQTTVAFTGRVGVGIVGGQEGGHGVWKRIHRI